MAYRCKTILVPILLLCLGFQLLAQGTPPEDDTKEFRERIWSVLGSLTPGQLPLFRQGLPVEGPLIEYWTRYGADWIEAFPGWHLGLLSGPKFPLGVLILSPQPEQDRKTVILFFHGYVTHVANYLPFFNTLVKAGYTVVAADLPGHGLSGGPIRGDVEDFSDYGLGVGQLKGWVDSIPEWNEHERIGMGHSTGALAFFEYTSHHPQSFKKLVLGAPLVRSQFYGLSVAGYYLVGWMNAYWGNTYTDPLAPHYFPMHWLKSLIEWNDRVGAYPVQLGTQVLFIYGDNDSVVEVKDNVAFLATKFPRNESFFVPGLTHYVYQEKAYRERVWARVLDFLEDQE